jgi:hypothetical protein
MDGSFASDGPPGGERHFQSIACRGLVHRRTNAINMTINASLRYGCGAHRPKGLPFPQAIEGAFMSEPANEPGPTAPAAVNIAIQRIIREIGDAHGMKDGKPPITLPAENDIWEFRIPLNDGNTRRVCIYANGSISSDKTVTTKILM